MRHRYVGFVIESTEKQLTVERTELINEIRLHCRHLFNKDYGELGIRLIRFDGKKGIIKCNHTEKENAINLLKSMKKISSHEVKIETLGTSGTIKALIRKHMYNGNVFAK